jgi:hypothetical protein
MPRVTIPKKTSDAVLGEYSHRCAICGSDRPHLHHIDENPSNNDLGNLLPLCPNCHLRDQHNPTHRIEVAKLLMFRSFKDPAILKPQFHPLFARQEFLATVAEDEEPVADLERRASELVELVQAMEMGEFYAKRLSELLAPLRYGFVMSLGGPDPEYERQVRQRNKEYRAKLVANRTAAQALLVELLRYQRWANEVYPSWRRLTDGFRPPSN